MKKFEYLVLSIDDLCDQHAREPSDYTYGASRVQDALNALGAEGWELKSPGRPGGRSGRTPFYLIRERAPAVED